MRRKRFWCLSMAVGLALALPLDATTIRGVTLEESIDLSGAIVAGTVVGQRAVRDGDGGILTLVTLRVEESLKGPYAAGGRLEIAAWGGEIGAARQVALGEARYARGERVLLQLETIDGRLHTLGLALGKWSLARDARGGDHLTRSLAGLAVAGEARMTEGPLDLESFRALVLTRTGGRQ